ncbi:MAG TPA: hypothetical protein VGP25_03860 [Gemmatimonadaceae bacterium]|nr:hypothetical protein [Gemmatimonadaceae bacterium]
MSTLLEPTTQPFAHAPSRSIVLGWAWHAYAVVAAAGMVVIGLMWDISWHMSIGRDTFWTPAHLLIQGGGLLAGGTSGLLALHTTFRGSAEAKASAVSFWGFRAPLGAWVSVLGCGAMLTSAPFDDWWHDAYGLDVRIVSPPHILLGLGMMGIVLGALLRTLALQNATDGPMRRRAALMFAVSSGYFLTILAILLFESSPRATMHSAVFYATLSRVLPLLLVAVAVAGRGRWPATTAALVYTILVAGTGWVLMLFPATPKLGPIYQSVTHYVPVDFPLLLVVPAFALDLTWRRVRERPWWLAAIALGAAFLVAFIAVQWPFAELLMRYGRNWFFHIDNFVYWRPPTSEHFAFEFRAPKPGDPSLAAGLAAALLFASLSSAIGRAWGGWMTRVRR